VPHHQRVTRGDAKIDYRRFACACEGIIQTPVISRHRDDVPVGGRKGIAVQAGRPLPCGALAACLAMHLQIVEAGDLPGGM
jgi:hypothetical protein